MSQVKISGNASGTGILTVAAPNTNSNYTLTLPANTGTILTTASSGLGKVLQVVTTDFPTVVSQAGTAGTWFDISGFSASITPSSASSRILVLISIGRVAETAGVHTSAFRVLRGATPVGVGSGMTGSQVAASFTMTIWASDSQQGGGTANSFVDSPNTTSSTTYQVQWMVQGTRTWVLNRTQNNVNTNDSYGAYTLSTITLMEIAA